MTDWAQAGKDVRKALTENVNSDSVKTEALKNIGKKLHEIGVCLKEVLQMIAPNKRNILMGPGYVPKMIAEADNETVVQKYMQIREKLNEVKTLIEEWDENFSDRQSNPHLFVDPKIINSTIDALLGKFIEINGKLKNESWFLIPQGNNLTNYKLSQIAYRDYFNALTAYYVRTDKEYELTKNLPEERQINKSAPITNLLASKPNLLKSLEGFELPTA